MDATPPTPVHAHVTSLLGDVQRHAASNKSLSLALVVIFATWFYRRYLRPKQRITFPVWATIEVALTSFIVSNGGAPQRIYSSIRRYGGSFFGLTSKHQVLVNLSGVDRLMSQSHHTLTAEPMQYTIFTRVFGATDSAQLKTKLEISWEELLKPIEDMFLNNAAATAALESAGIPKKASSFVSFTSHADHMMRWERSADTKILETGQNGRVEANLQSLTRDFGACIAIPLLYGQDFLDRYSELLDDFWKFDNEVFPLLMIGIPPWAPLKIMKDGVAARSRLLNNIDALYRRIEQFQNGDPIDFGADMTDISKTALERNRVYAKKEWSFRERGGGDLAILWGQNANTQPIFFWFIAYVYSTPGLVEQLRAEVSPFVGMSQEDPLELISIDFPGLFAGCPRLKACIFETYRMANEATSIRYVARSVKVQDGEYQHQLQPGMFVSAPHSVIQRDPAVYPSPNEFVPDRFLETDASGKMIARYGKLRPWGSGAAMCKGRSFAEKEIISLGAAVISLWDIAPVGATWEIPTMIPGTGVKKPVKDIRVLITRRQQGG